MSKTAFLYCFIALCVSSAAGSLFAQETVMLEGKVVNDSIEHEYLHILNLSLQKGTVTRENGDFTIPVRSGDTLYISAVQFKHQELVVSAEIVNRKYLEVKLEPEVTELEDVQISNIELNGRLGDDMNRIKLEKPFDPAEAGLPVYKGPILTQEERRLYTATHSGAGIIPVDAVINAISGRTKMLKEQVRISNMERRVQKARNLVSDTTYIRQLQIPARYIDDFAHYVYFDKPEALAIAATQNPLSILEMLLKQAPAYLQHKSEEGVEVNFKDKDGQ
ncbi:carboxypeptidase-like regulatory domain-containing protein [Leeuwenhoekiella parthenopeia]|uniref:Carboxypeptidase-like regulatory domain-containing protein n=1 Tax=Leeuwenhoekiella parthenopeia TaxID=2890320 RepID=A0ABS8GW76_9FLAO|nr:carboxypeptidase-like regulatory domain-containing protein [Leeuwenhoekiella parthenopeia]MCC4214274.1 carboxypeptidase-like regulatory domain-containing protein [Leeuwenhoekiella parthenopeia]